METWGYHFLVLTITRKMSSNESGGLYFIKNCTKSSANLTIDQWKAYNLVWSISGLSMATLTLVILLILLLARSYRRTLQRLFLYLTISTLFSLTNNSLNLVLHSNNFNNNICKGIGYTDVSLFTTSLLLASGIGLYLLFITYYHAQGKSLPKVGAFKASVIELVYVLGALTVPPGALSKNVDKFGMAGALCWIEMYDENCDRIPVNKRFELEILVTFTAIMAINISIFVLLKLISCLLAYHHKHVRDHHIRMAKRASLLVTCLTISLIINLSSLWAHHSMTETKVPYPVLIATAVLIPASPIIMPIGFILYLKSAKKLKHLCSFDRLKKHASFRKSKSRELLVPPHGDGGVSPRHPRCQADPPSVTMSQEVGYTGAFTSVSRNDYGSIEQTTCSE